MNSAVDFIGIGAQKSGTSWAYACLYEHPDICAPVKEIHFFSRSRFSEGRDWYEHHFRNCTEGKLSGEFSTSYLYSEAAAERIHSFYPHAKLIAILRNPIDRAFSQYRNAIKAGEISESVSFETYMRDEPSVLAQGLYEVQLERFYSHFDPSNILVLIYEDIRRDPIAFMRKIYVFLGVQTDFVSSMVHDEINVARTPKHVFVDRMMHHVSESLRRIGFDRVVHLIRKSGLPDFVRSFNTKKPQHMHHSITYGREAIRAHFKDDVQRLSTRLGRDLHTEWNI